MRWEAWTLVAWFIANALLAVALIGRPRPVITPGAAVFILAALYAGQVYLVLRLAGVA